MYGPTSVFNFNSLVGRYQFKAFFRKSSERSFSSSINQIKAFPDSGILRWTSMKTFNTAHTSYSRIHTAKLHLLQNSKFLKLWLDLCLFIVIYQVYYQSEFVRVPVYVAFRKLEFLESLISISCRDFLYEIWWKVTEVPGLLTFHTNLLPFISTVTVLCCDLWELLQYGFFKTICNSSFSYRFTSMF